MEPYAYVRELARRDRLSHAWLLLGEDGQLFTAFGFTVTMYMLNKTLATLIVMIWNYFTKRAILRGGWLQKKKTPDE